MKAGEVMTILDNALRIGKGVTRYGKVATYIPELAKKDKNKLGICLYTIDGDRFEVGNTEDIDKIADILRELGDHYLEEDVASIPLSLTAYMKVTSFNPVVYEVCYMDKERQQRTVEEEKLRKEAVQELLIYQG